MFSFRSTLRSLGKLYTAVALVSALHHSRAAAHNSCHAALGPVTYVDVLVHGDRSLTDDFIYSREILTSQAVARLTGLPELVRASELRRLNLEILADKDEVAQISGLDFHSTQELKQPLRNRQLIAAILARDAFQAAFARPSLETLQVFLDTVTAGQARYPLTAVVDRARKAHAAIAADLRRGEWIEIFGSYPMLQAVSGRSDVDVVLSDRLERDFRRWIKGGMLENGTFANPLRRDAEAERFRQSFLDFERALGFGPAAGSGQVLSVATRPTTVSRGAELVDGTYDDLLRHLTLPSPVTVRIRKEGIRLRLYDGISPRRGRPAKVREMEL